MSEYTLKPLSKAERLYAYKQSQQIAGQTGFYGYYHGDFGKHGDDYNAVWLGNSNTEMTDDFRNELADIMNELGTKSEKPFADRNTMSAFCLQNSNAAMKGNFCEEYGFRLDTDKYSYFIRMEPYHKGDYDFYVFAYEKRWLDRHIKKASKGIRFIHSDYTPMFNLEDRDNIMIKYPDGESKVQECRFIDEYHTQIGSNIYHICQFAELFEKNSATVIPYRKSLPPECYLYDSDTNEIVEVKKGHKYAKVVEQAPFTTNEENTEYVNKLNADIGVSVAQSKAMECGMTYGWDIDSADLRNYDTAGKYLKGSHNRDDYER